MATNKKIPKQTNNKKTVPQKGGINKDVFILATLAVCILLLLSNFGLIGFVGKWLSTGMKYLFGFIAYPFPFVLLFSVLFIAMNEGKKRAYFKIGCFVVLIILLCTLLQLINDSGGITGGLLVKLFEPLIGTVGTYILVVILILICLVLITNKSILSGVKKGGQLAYEQSIKTSQRYKEKKAERNTEKEILRKDKVVKGVNIGATIPKAQPNVTELKPTKRKYSDPPLDDVMDNKDEVLETSFKEIETSSIPFFGGNDSYEEKEKPTINNLPTKVIEKAQKPIEVEIPKKKKSKDNKDNYQVPPLNLLKKGKNIGGDSKSHVEAMAKKLSYTLEVFNVDATVTNITQGPSITRYEIKLDPGVKVDKVVKLRNEIMLYMKASTIHIEAPIPGKDTVGIEIPNETGVMVRLRDLLETSAYQEMNSNLTFAVGRDISGNPVIADIAKMPHLLIAGATGSGKSVGINTLIMSILYKVHKDDVKMIMIDPKVVELSIYNNIPHLMIPVVTDPKKAANALNWAVAEMEKRYMTFASLQVRDLESYHNKITTLPENGDVKLNKMPQIIIIVDEMADLMMVAKAEVETAICRIAQKARAAGIHLILATQRPSVDVITGLIKANMPSRIAFKTSSSVDSRTILDRNGAENLLGNGDMFFAPANFNVPERVQCGFISDSEVESVVSYLVKQNGEATYDKDVEEEINKDNIDDSASASQAASSSDDRDALFYEAGQFIIEKDKASIGMLQRVFKIGFNRAARIMDQLADAHVVGGEEGTKARQILMSAEEFEDYLDKTDRV